MSFRPPRKVDPQPKDQEESKNVKDDRILHHIAEQKLHHNAKLQEIKEDTDSSHSGTPEALGLPASSSRHFACKKKGEKEPTSFDTHISPERIHGGTGKLGSVIYPPKTKLAKQQPHFRMDPGDKNIQTDLSFNSDEVYSVTRNYHSGIGGVVSKKDVKICILKEKEVPTEKKDKLDPAEITRKSFTTLNKSATSANASRDLGCDGLRRLSYENRIFVEATAPRRVSVQKGRRRSTFRPSLGPATLLPPEDTARRLSVLRQMTLHKMMSGSITSLATNETAERRRPDDQQKEINNLEDLEEEIEEEIINALDGTTTEKKALRADLGFVGLVVHDYKRWKHRRRRKKYKHEANPLLQSAISTIEGFFGSGVVSFFIFLRWIIELNMVLSLVWGFFVVLPNALPLTDKQPSNVNSTYDGPFYLRNFLDGGKWLSHSVMFYEAYSMDIGYYPAGLFFLLCILFTYFGGFIFVLKNIAHAIQEEGLLTRGVQYRFASIIFSSWDYSIVSSEASENLSKGIGQTFHDLFIELQTQEVIEQRSRKEAFKITGRRILAWLITLFLVGGGSVTIFIFVSADIVQLYAGFGMEISRDHVLALYTPTVVFVGINTAVPEILYLLPLIEHYAKGKLQMYTTITRVFVIRMVNVVALVVSLHIKIKRGLFTGCAGTLVGQELYKLVILDTVLQTFLIALPNLGRYFWTMDREEFQMPPLVLKLLYRQALIWIGTIVCPVMPFIGTTSQVILFWTVYAVVSVACKPPSKRWNQPRRSIFFMGLTAATLAIIIIIISIVIASDSVNLGLIQGSKLICGPFGNHTILDIYNDFKESVLEYEPTLFEFLDLATSAIIILPVILIMVACVFYQHLRIKWEKKRNFELQNEIYQEQDIARELTRKIHEHGLELPDKTPALNVI